MQGWRDIPSVLACRFGGIPVRIDALYPVMAISIFISLIGRNAPSFVMLAAFGLLTLAGATLSIFLHEVGHAAAARYFGLRTDEIRIGGFYGFAVIEQQPVPRWQEIAILLAGPLANAMIFFWLWVMLGRPGLSDRLYFDYGPATFETFKNRNWLVGTTTTWLAYFNLGMLVFNLVPAFPLDGGRIWRIALSESVPDARLVRMIAYAGVFIGAWSFLGAAAYPALFAAGIMLIYANYGIAKGQIPAPD